MKTNELKDKAPIDFIELEVVEKSEPREFHSGKLCNCTGKDDTGSVKITLWNDDVDKVSVGDTIKIEKGWCSSFNNELQISSGKFGILTIEKKSDANNSSDSKTDDLVQEEDMR